MKALIHKSGVRPSLLSVLSLKSNSCTLIVEAVNHAKFVYYVENCNPDGKRIDIDYTLNDDWKSISILKADLRRFVVTEGLNDYCFDHCANGEHIQDAGSFDLDTYLVENLNSVVVAYLQAKKIGQNAN